MSEADRGVEVNGTDLEGMGGINHVHVYVARLYLLPSGHSLAFDIEFMGGYRSVLRS